LGEGATWADNMVTGWFGLVVLEICERTDRVITILSPAEDGVTLWKHCMDGIDDSDELGHC